MAAEIVPLSGEIRACHERVRTIEASLKEFAVEHRLAIAELVLASNAQDAVDTALDHGDIEAAKRANVRAKQHIARSTVRRERAATITTNLAGFLATLRGWLRGVGL
ncbi:MAG: hypothetical protein PHS14_16420 [Elusimicrobia bacterium]|nr:hypothetical protein [Elusimicrobiota bacterium]